jgi:hypothetical protein
MKEAALIILISAYLALAFGMPALICVAKEDKIEKADYWISVYVAHIIIVGVLIVCGIAWAIGTISNS